MNEASMTQAEFESQETPRTSDRSIGEIIRCAFSLSSEQVEQIILHQQQHNTRFGESAVALGLIKSHDVLWALSQQFAYPYSTQEGLGVSKELVLAINPFGEGAEVFRNLRSDILTTAFGPEMSKKSLAVVSHETGEGKSFFAANLAIAFSQLGGRTLLVDADMRNPRQHKIFNLSDQHGLSSVLSGRMNDPVFSKPHESLPCLYVLPVGVIPPNPTELLQKGGLTLLLAELQLRFDYVIIDTPAGVYGSDAKMIASKCGSSLVITRKNHAHLSNLETFSSSLTRAGASVLGVVLNNH
jgi:protein-tyrosine kinase